jgi:hypothetical protein
MSSSPDTFDAPQITARPKAKQRIRELERELAEARDMLRLVLGLPEPWTCAHCGGKADIVVGRDYYFESAPQDVVDAAAEVKRARDALVERAEKAEAALSQIREWIDGFDNPTTGMGSGMHQEKWPMLGPGARARLREILEGVIP